VLFASGQSAADGARWVLSRKRLSDRQGVLRAGSYALHSPLSIAVNDAADIQQGMGTERTLTNGAVKAVICPSNTYGVVATKYGVVHSPCTACPTNMVTGYPITDVKAADIDYHVGSGTGLTATELFAITAEPVATITTAAGAASASGSGTGYYSVKACLNRPGFGYYNGASQKCPQGFYNAAGTDTPCSQ
jgi:hypothetical protein